VLELVITALERLQLWALRYIKVKKVISKTQKLSQRMAI